MKGRLFFFSVVMCFVCAGIWSCGETIPGSVSLCQRSNDCGAQQVCVGNVCVSRQIHGGETPSITDSHAGETPDPPEETPVNTEEPAQSEQIAQDQNITENSPDAGEPQPEKTVTETQPKDASPETGPVDASAEARPEEHSAEIVSEPVPEAVCRSGATMSCYPFVKGKPGVGTCKAGSSLCDASGQWGPCVGAQGPKDKDICGDGQDNNCDGTIDDGCQCIHGEQRDCGVNVGVCTKGKQTCFQGTWGACQGAISPAPSETCLDGRDNDCDGVVDEGCPCDYLNKKSGVCSSARRDGQGTCRPPATYRATEKCGDKLDNNCNGYIDEDCPCLYQNSSKGVCATAKTSATGVCLPPADYQSVEKCDNKDNNCNGQTDENIPGLGVPCTVSGKRGECAKGTNRCVQGKLTCVATQPGPKTEVCDLKDNNCNGQIDDVTTRCYRTINGYCRFATTICVGSTPVCRVDGNSTVQRCQTDATCNQVCPAGHRYKCNNLGGGTGQFGCKVQP